MPHTYTSSLFHIIFSMQQRTPAILAESRERLWSFIGGIARKNEMKALVIGGTADHVHILLSLPATMALSKAVQLIKGGSSKWVHDTFPNQRRFAWQEGYGAFSVSVSHLAATVA